MSGASLSTDSPYFFLLLLWLPLRTAGARLEARAGAEVTSTGVIEGIHLCRNVNFSAGKSTIMCGTGV